MAADNKNKTLLQLVGVVVFMGAMAWASVPFYNWFCRVTGFGGTTNVASATTGTVLDREIKIRFDGSKARDFPWEFKPAQTEMTMKIGEDGLAFYEAYNPTDKPIAGQASYNVYPYEAGGYFNNATNNLPTAPFVRPAAQAAKSYCNRRLPLLHSLFDIVTNPLVLMQMMMA